MTSPATREDPFEQLVSNCRIALDFVAERRDRAGTEHEARAVQAERIEAAMAILAGEAPVKATKGKQGGNTHVWTPEQREAASQRMKARNAERAGATAPLASTPGAAHDAGES